MILCGMLHPHPAMSTVSETAAHRQREGTNVKQIIGEIRETGRRWLFITNQGTSYQILENLALQRAVQAARDDAKDRHWAVDGELTEFLGENYLLINRLMRTKNSATLEGVGKE